MLFYARPCLLLTGKAETHGFHQDPSVGWFLDGFVSFKTVPYLFYLLILALSVVVTSYPHLLGESLVGFIDANRYTILLLISFDRLSAQFSQDREVASDLKSDFQARVAWYSARTSAVVPVSPRRGKMYSTEWRWAASDRSAMASVAKVTL